MWDPTRAMHSIQRLKTLARLTGGRIFPSHDPVVLGAGDQGAGSVQVAPPHHSGDRHGRAGRNQGAGDGAGAARRAARDVPGRHGRGRAEDRDPARDHRGRGHQAARRLRLREPQQAVARAQHEGAGGPGDLRQARRHRRRHRGGLPPRRHEAAGGRLRDALRREPAARVLLALRLRPQRPLQGLPGPRRQLPLAGRGAEPDRRAGPEADLPAEPGGRLRRGQHARRARHHDGALRARAHRPRPARGRLLPRHLAGPARGHAQHALLLERRHGPQARRGLPGRLLSVLRGLRDQGRQAPDHRLHRALALGELLQGDRPARTW